MFTAVVTSSGSSIHVSLVGGNAVMADEESAEEGAVPESDLNPIFPEMKEVIWGFGSFVVLALAMRLFLFRKVRDGMDSRYAKVQGDIATADTMMASARAEVADYEAQVAAVRADGHGRVEAARATLEAERAEQVAAANRRIAERRSAAAAEVEAAKTAARSQVEAAVGSVAGRAGELATGRAPSANTVSNAVAAAMSDTGVSA